MYVLKRALLLALTALFLFGVTLLAYSHGSTTWHSTTRVGHEGIASTIENSSLSPLPSVLKSSSRPTQEYFRQVWAAGDGPASDFDMPNLRQQCAPTERHADVF